MNPHADKVYTPVPVLAISKTDHGYTYVSPHHRTGETFIEYMTSHYNTSLGIVCHKIALNDTTLGNTFYSCSFVNHQCSNITKALGSYLYMMVPPANQSLHLSFRDALVQNGPDCDLNVNVVYDPLVSHDFLAVGLATLAKSQYIVFDYKYNQERVGFGGNYDLYGVPPEDEDKPKKKGIPAWAVVLMLAVAAVILGVIVYLYLQMRKKKIEGDLEAYEQLRQQEATEQQQQTPVKY